MEKKLLLISSKEKDIELAKKVSFLTGFELSHFSAIDEIANFLIQNIRTVVLWDIDSENNLKAVEKPSQSFISVGRVLGKETNSSKVFALSSFTPREQANVFQTPLFSHYLLRRFEDPAPLIYSKLMRASLVSHPFGLSNYFPENVKINRIIFEKYSQKNILVQAIENVLHSKGVQKRLAGSVAQAVDELIMNALFDAPVDAKGNQYRKGQDLLVDFTLSDKEKITVEFSEFEHYFGVCVSDQFGSLKKEIVLNLMSKDYRQSSYKLNSEKNNGLGLHQIAQKPGISLLLVSRPQVKTEVMIFFPKLTQMKDIKNTFNFISVIS